MATLDELVSNLANNAETAHRNSGGTKAAKLGDFNDESYEAHGGGEAVEQAVADELQRRGYTVGNAPQGYRIFGTDQEQIDAYEEASGIETQADPA